MYKRQVCKHCKKSGVRLTITNQKGLPAELNLSCVFCDFSFQFSNSNSVEYNDDRQAKKLFEINVRFIYAVRSIGKSKTGG